MGDLVGFFHLIFWFGVIGAAVWAWGYTNRCPACKAWNAKKLDNKEEIDRRTGYETVTRADRTKDRSGKTVRTTYREEQVRMTYFTYKNHYSCEKCNHTWTDTSTNKVEKADG